MVKHYIDAISSVTDYDYIKLISSFYAMTEDRVNCDKCLLRGKGRPNYEDYNYKTRKIQGCFEVKEAVIFPTEHAKYRSCIGNYRDPGFYNFLNLHDAYKKGINPFGGDLIDAPSKFVEVCNLLDNLMNKHQEEQLRKAQKNGK